MPPKIQMIFKCNPMFLHSSGITGSLLSIFLPFWKHPFQTLYFWIVAIAMFIIGALIFKKTETAICRCVVGKP